MDVYERLRLCTVKIGSPSASHQGTGFFVAPGLILTCRHVVDGEIDVSRSALQIYMPDMPDASPLDVRDLRRPPGPEPDLALLTVDADEHPCVFLDRAVDVATPLWIYAFPSVPDAVRAEPVTVETEGFRRERARQSDQSLLKFKGGQIQPGMSGGPVLNQETKRVCGVLKRTRGPDHDLGGLAIPVDIVFQQFPDLEEKQREYHARDRSWLDTANATVVAQSRRGSSRGASEDVGRLAHDIAEVTKWAIEEFEKLPGEEIYKLIDDPESSAVSASRRDGRLTDQAGAFEQMIEAVASRSPPTVALGGVSGVGKSSIMRRVGLRVAEQFMTHTASPGCEQESRPTLPIIINLSRVTARRGKASIGSTIVHWWLQYAGRQMRLFYRSKRRSDLPAKITMADLEGLREHYDLVGILDSADEFLERNVHFEEADLAEWVRQVGKPEAQEEQPFSQVFIARRSAENDGGRLAQACAKELRIIRLSEAVAKSMLPEGLWEELTGVCADDARDLLRTPFITTLFQDYGDKRLRVLADETRLDRIFTAGREGGTPAPPGALIEFAMRCYLWRDDSESDAPAPDLATLLHSAGMVALLLFAHQRREMTKEELRRASGKFSWIKFADLESRLDILCRRGILHRRSGSKREAVTGFSHKIWQDFSLAYLIASRIMEGHADILAGRAYNSMIFRDTGYLMMSNDVVFNAELAKDVLDTRDQFAFAQLVSILAHGPAMIDADALQMLGDALLDQSGLAAHVALSSAGSRALTRFPGDPVLNNIRAAVIEWSMKLKAAGNAFPPITHSLADCLMSELNGDASVIEEISPSDLVDRIYPFAHAEDASHRTSALQRHGLEASYISVIAKSFQEAPRIIGAAHYAVLAASCCARSAGRRETAFELAKLLERREMLIEAARATHKQFAAGRIETLLNLAADLLSEQVGLDVRGGAVPAVSPGFAAAR